jgi:hypothetical protein
VDGLRALNLEYAAGCKEVGGGSDEQGERKMHGETTTYYLQYIFHN